ncbi:MAG TPA: GxxExxY protein [Pirellulales bacterium]|nr:GxxExxY protein [Pirellulales bacterium]
MPVTLDCQLRKLSQAEFGDLAYEVMGHVFDIHRDFGPLFDEEIYQVELARRIAGARIEVPIEVAFGGFRKTYYVDLLVDQGAFFELKTVETLHDRHRSQLLNYLLLTDTSHGKLVNLRPGSVEHEFVNTTLTLRDRTTFHVDDAIWDVVAPEISVLKDYVVGFLRDLGTGLDLSMYEEAITYFLGGDEAVNKLIDVVVDGHVIGAQPMRCAALGVAFRLTTAPRSALPHFDEFLRRFVRHTTLECMLWINITRGLVTFRTFTSKPGR